MKYLELIRHAARQKPGNHLSPEGVRMARKLGENRGPFAKVITSNLVRAVETAVAMGFAVDEESALLADYSNNVQEEVDWGSDIVTLTRAFKQGKKTADFANNLREFLQVRTDQLSDGENILVVSHGGILELTAIACVPNADHASWGDVLGFCEGFRLSFDGKKFQLEKVLRL